jgi:hypothetical protein
MTAPGLPILGLGSHSTDELLVEVLADAEDQLSTPRDLAFSPDSPDQLWVLNFATTPLPSGELREGGSMTVLHDADTDAPISQHFWEGGGGSAHFMSNPSAFAFGLTSEMASIHETLGETPLTAPDTPDEFMGPALHDTDLAIFKAGWSDHLDMLHDSPWGMGIAWDQERVYWVFDGFHSSLTRYDFGVPHPDVPGGHGGEDHEDGDTRRYLVQDPIKRAPDVSSHMVLDHDTGLLYIADTGNVRIAVLDTATGDLGQEYPGFDNALQRFVTGAELWTLIDADTVELEQPSGVELHDGHLWVTDNATSRIYAFTLDGEVVDWLDTGLPAGALMGITLDPQGRIYIVDSVGDQVLRISVP